jgi:hypothetical protein
MKKVFIAFMMFLFYLFTGEADAQRFNRMLTLGEIENLSGSPCKVVLPAGDIQYGEIFGFSSFSGELFRLNFKPYNGKRYVLKTKGVSSITIKFTDEDDSLVLKPVIIRRLFCKKSRFLQLLNPGFDGRIEVFRKHEKDEMSGDPYNIEDINYLVVKDNVSQQWVGAYFYEMEFRDLFSDCEAVVSKYGNRISIKDLARHVALFNTSCK